jgi:hypothetical protein
MWEVMIVCVIMHNMIIEEERDENVYGQGWNFQGELVAPRARTTGGLGWLFFKSIMKCKTVQLTTDSKKICSNIYKIMLETTSPFLFILFEFKWL